MQQCPETPRLDADSEEQFSGHVWVQEYPTGGPFRFQVAQSGLLTFGTAERTYETVDSVPAPYRSAARAVSDQLDRAALRAATDDPGTVTFCGVATWHDGIAYDWQSLPPFLGTDIWSGTKGTVLAPDTATGVFDRLGLPTLPAVEKEQPAAHTDFSRYEDPAAFPESAWRDGRAAGVLIRDKAGGRAVAWRQNRGETEPTETDWTAETLAAEYATTERIERTVSALRDTDRALAVEAIRDRLVADLAREAHEKLYPDGTFVASMDRFESAVAERVQREQFSAE